MNLNLFIAGHTGGSFVAAQCRSMPASYSAWWGVSETHVDRRRSPPSAWQQDSDLWNVAARGEEGETVVAREARSSTPATDERGGGWGLGVGPTCPAAGGPADCRDPLHRDPPRCRPTGNRWCRWPAGRVPIGECAPTTAIADGRSRGDERRFQIGPEEARQAGRQATTR
jgi:hypothetical protein